MVGSLHSIPRTSTSLEQVGPCVEGDAAAWNRLYTQHSRVARAFLYRLGVEREHLDDAVQEVFLEVYRYLPSFRGDCSFTSWLYRLCATQARQIRRQRKRRLLLNLAMVERPSSQVTRGELHHEIAERLVQEALSQLGEKERLVFVLYEFEGVGGREIGEIAGCPESTVWRRLHYARKTFVAYVDEHGATK